MCSYVIVICSPPGPPSLCIVDTGQPWYPGHLGEELAC